MWVRTWPAKIPEGRSYVVDGLPRIVMDSYNYVPVLEQLAENKVGTVIIEWDLAVSAESHKRFNSICRHDPFRVHVAPYQLYPRSTNLPKPVWAHRRVGRNPPWITRRDRECDLFGFGLVYLPLAIVQKHLATDPGVTSDSRFSQWHHAARLGPVPVHWDVRPVHLHY
jgi:hypothetical protein